MKGLELNQLFYKEIVAGILKSNFPHLKYSAVLIGWGSEVLGYDDAQSADHNWGLRFQLFLSEKDHVKYSDSINKTLAGNLPEEFLGFPTTFEIHVNSDQRGERKNIKHNIEVETIERFFSRYLGCNPHDKIKAADWLTFSEHKLLTVMRGKVFYNGLSELESIRRKFTYYPHDVWLYILAAQWTKIFEEQAFVGRCGQVGDELGSALIAVRQIKNLMRLCFLIERKYAPYSKWFGTAFSRLDCADKLEPLFEEVLQAKNWRERQQALGKACAKIIQLFNDLNIVSPISEEIAEYFSRPFLVIKDESVVEKLLSAIKDGEIKNIKHKLGSVNQFVDSNAQLNDVSLIQKLKLLYR